MSIYIPEYLRSLVAKRANYCCEYCHLPERNSFFTFQVDHITSLKHSGETEAENLAYACALCNRNKGSDLGTRLVKDGPLIPFFNPRIDKWSDHFAMADTGEIIPLSDIGQGTIKILDMNHPDSIIERRNLIEAGIPL